MLKTAIEVAGIAEYFEELLSVDVLKCYVWPWVTDWLQRNLNVFMTLPFSSNNWDVSGAIHLALLQYGWMRMCSGINS